MLNLKVWMSSLLVLAITVLPVMAGSNDAKTTKENSTNATAEATPAAASPNLAATPGDANVTALLGVLVTKGVLAPNEANAIRDADPKAQFQALVEVLSRKGIVSAADLSAAATPATQPAAPAAAPVEARESVSSSQAGPEASPQAQTQPQPPYPSRVAGEVKPPPAAVAPAVTPVRVFPID